MAKLHRILFGAALIASAHVTVAQNTPASPDSGSTAPADTSGASAGTSSGTSGTTDPYVQRREERKQAKTEYKESKKAAKEEYKHDKEAADEKLKAARDEEKQSGSSGK